MTIPEKYKNNIFYRTFHKSRLFYFKMLVFLQKRIVRLKGILFIFKQIINNPQKIKNGINIILTEGFSTFFDKIDSQRYLDKINTQYQIWIKNNWPNKKELNKQIIKQKRFKYKPKISIITPVYNPNPKWLIKCIDSVINQSYYNWELCLADDYSSDPEIKKILNKYKKRDKRIKIVFRKKNGHIGKASNSALELATGEFIGLLDHDDELSLNALFEIVKVLNKNKKLDFIYSDEDKIESKGKHVNPFFKPDWSPDMFMSFNYICHLSIIRKKIIDKIGGFKTEYKGAQDYDLFLRVTEKTKKIYHIPNILYSWRETPTSTSFKYSIKGYAEETSIKALRDVLIRKGIKGKAEKGLVEGTFRTKYKIIGKPLVSIIIPTKDKVEYLKRCINSIIKKSTYSNHEIIIVDTGSTKATTKKYYKNINKNKKIKFLKWEGVFNYSSVNNFAVKKAKGKYILLLNNDTEVITPDWIESMLEHAQRKDIGAVGVKLLYPNKTIQHGGVTIGVGGAANHASLQIPNSISQTFPVPNSKDVIRNFSAVTAACLMVSKEKFLLVNGLDETFRIAFNDVDFCLKLLDKKLLNIYTPYTILTHYESTSVGRPEDGNRDTNEFGTEIKKLSTKWKKYIKNDPYYNKNLSLTSNKNEIKTKL